MEILKIGDELTISGYQPITLSDSMDENIQNFAQANAISTSEAKSILYSAADFQNFVNALNSVDEEAEYTDTNFDKELSNIFKASSTKNTAEKTIVSKNTAEKTIASKNTNEKTIASNDEKVISSNAGVFSGSSSEELLQDSLAETVKQITNIQKQLSDVASKKSEALLKEDAYAQYQCEQQESKLNAQLKPLVVKQAQLEASLNGQTLSNTQTSLIEQKFDVDFRLQRIEENRNYLSAKLINISNDKEEAMYNGDEYRQYVYEQQENAIIALDKILGAEQFNIEKETESLQTNLDTLKKYSSKSSTTEYKNLESTFAEIENIKAQLTNIGNSKTEAMYNVDEQAQYQCEQQESKLNAQLKKLIVKQAQLEASLNGQTLSSTQTSLIEQKFDVDVRLQRIEEKRSYLDYKISDIANGIAEAMYNGDENAQYVYEQQQNSINALDIILEMEQTNTELEAKRLQESIDKLQNCSSKLADIDKYSSQASTTAYKNLETTLNQIADIQAQLCNIGNSKAEAMYNEDENALNNYRKQEDELNSQLKKLLVKQAEQEAILNGTTLSSAHASLIEEYFDTSLNLAQTIEKRQQLNYKVTNIANSKTEALYIGDENAMSVYEQQENSINDADKQLEIQQQSLEKQVNTLKTSLDALNKTLSDTSTNTTTSTNSTTSTNTTIITAETSSTNNSEVKNVLGLFGLDVNTKVDSLIYTGSTVTGVVINGTKYEAQLSSVGIVTSSKITDATGKVIKETSYIEEDPIEVINRKIVFTEDEIQTLINPLVAKVCRVFNEDVQAIVRKAIEDAADAYYRGTPIGSLEYYISTLLNNYGLNSSVLYQNLQNKTQKGLEIIDACNTLTNYIDQKIELETTVPEFESKTENIGGINIKVTYKYGSPDYTITTLEDGSISITGNNCTVDILGLGVSNKNVKISGSNITFNNNNLTFASVTNESTNSVISGSFGDDTITNNGNYSTIKGGDGDDRIISKGLNAYIIGENGNDTIISYGENAKIDGGQGADAINYLKGTNPTIMNPDVNDKVNIFETTTSTPATEPIEYQKTFTINGVTFTAYSNTPINDDSISTSVYSNVLTINASNCKIVVNSTTEDDSAIKLKGDSIVFETKAHLKSVFNYADNSKITGSQYQDYLYNYANNVEISGNDGDDVISNEGTNVKISGDDGADTIYNRKNAGSTTISETDGADYINNDSSSKPVVTYSTSSDASEKVNVGIIMDYLDATWNNFEIDFVTEPNNDVKKNAQELVQILLTTNSNNELTLSDEALKLIEYGKSLNTSDVTKTRIEYLVDALTKRIEDGNTNADDIINITSSSAESELDVDTEIATYLSSSSIKLLGLTDVEIENFLNTQASKEDALKLLKQIDVIIRANSYTKSYTAGQLKEILLNNQFTLNNEIQADAQILVDAQNTSDPDAYIKSQMIKDGTGMSAAQLLSNTSAGEVIERDGILYVNDGSKMVQLNISAETYLELFPPVERYLVEQNTYTDCFFIATAMIDMMESDEGRAKILQMFSEDSSGNITVTFPGVSSYPVTFANGKLKATDGQYSTASQTVSTNTAGKRTTAALGLQMLEQAYALAKFAEISNSDMTSSEISSYYNSALSKAIQEGKISASQVSSMDMDKALLFYKEGGYAFEVYADITGSDTFPEYETIPIANQNAKAFVTRIYSQYFAESVEGTGTVTTMISGNVELPDEIATKYNLITGHQYAVENIDPINEIVYIKNPWQSYEVTAIPYDVFIKYFYGFCGIKY